MFYTKPDLDLSSTAEAPPSPDQEFASRGEVFNTARKAILGANTVWSEFWNASDVYDEHIKKVKGIAPDLQIENPETDYYVSQDSKRFYSDFDAYKAEGGGDGYYGFKRTWNERRFREELGKVAEQYPDKASEILPEVSFLSRAYQAARKSETDAADALNRSRQGVLDYGASFAGSLAGGFQDPLTLMTAPVGFAGGVGTGVRGLAMGFLKNGVANAGVEAVMQPFIQADRARAGLESGWAEGAANVRDAFLTGGLLDVGVRGSYRAYRALRGFEPVVRNGAVVGYRKPAADGAPEVTIAPDMVSAAEAGDATAIREIAEKSGLADDPVVRTTLDAMDANEAIARKPRETVSDVEHAASVTQSLRHASDPTGEPPLVRVSEGVPEAVASPAAVAKTLDELPPELKAEIKKLTDAGQQEIADLSARVAMAVRAQQPDMAPMEALQLVSRVTTTQDAVGLSGLLRQYPALAGADLHVSEGTVRHAQALAALSPEAYGRVASGEVAPDLGMLIANHVADPAMHDRAMSDLRAMNPGTETEARRQLAEMLQSPDYNPGPVDVGPGPGLAKKALDDPYGSDAKKQVARLEQQLAEEMGRKAEAEAPPVPRTAEQAQAERVQAINTLDSIRGLVREVIGVSPDEAGVEIKVFSSVGENPAARLRLREAIVRYAEATADAERATARSVLDGINDAHGFSVDNEIWLAAYAMNPKQWVAHELVHALRRLGKLTQAEVAQLAERARKLGLFSGDREAAYKAELDSRKLTAERTAELLDEEAAAWLMTSYFRGQSVDLPKPVLKKDARILDRLATMFADLKQRLTGAVGAKDVPPADAVRGIIDAFTSGEIARRQVMREAMAAEDITALAVKPEAMMAMGDGLDMSPEARKQRAEQMGFDTGTVWYHGTNAKFDAFDETRGGGGVWLTLNKGQAESFGDPGGYYVRADRFGTMMDYLKARQAAVAAGTELGSTEFARAMVADLKSKGFDGIRDPKFRGAGGVGEEVVMLLDPTNIRSVNAAFDPANANSPNLMFAMGDDSASERTKIWFRGDDKKIGRPEVGFGDFDGVFLTSSKDKAASYGDVVSAYSFGGKLKRVNVGEDFYDDLGPQYVDRINRMIADAKRDGADALLLVNSEIGDELVVFDGGKLEARNPMFAMGDQPVTPGLDMSPEARRQRAEQMGFDTSKVLYRGGRSFDEDMAGPVWLAETPEYASGFPVGARGNTAIAPVYIMRGDTLDLTSIPADQAFMSTGSVKDALRIRHNRADDAIGSAIDPSFGSELYGFLDLPEVQEHLAGYYSYVRVNQHAPHGEGVGVLALKPWKVRSTNAAFDPANSNSPNLMFAMGDTPEPRQPLDMAALAGRLSDVIAPFLEASRAAEMAELMGSVERDGGGNITALYRDGKKYTISRGDDGSITGIVESDAPASPPLTMDIERGPDGLAARIQAMGQDYVVGRDSTGQLTDLAQGIIPRLAEQEQAVTAAVAQIIEQSVPGLPDGRAGAIATEAVAIARAAPSDPVAALNALTDLVNRTALEVEQAQVMFAMRDERGLPKAGAAERAAVLQQDLAEIEAQFQAAGGDERLKLHAKRGALLNAKALESVVDDARRYKNAAGQADAAEGFLRLHESDAVGGGARDVATMRDALRGEFEGMIDKLIWKFRKGAITGDLRRKKASLKADMDDVIKEAAGVTTGNALAKEIAKGWGDAAELARQKFNVSGGDIGKLDGWYAPQYHDPEAWMKAGRDAIIDYFVPGPGKPPVLDRTKMVDRDGTPLSDIDLKKLIGDIWWTVTTEGKNKFEPGAASMGKGALYKQHMEHRVLHYASPEAWIAYNKEFGSGDIYASMVGHLDMMARDISALDRFGANPDLVRERAKVLLLQDAAKAVSAKSVLDDLNDKVAKLKATMQKAPTAADTIMAEIGRVHTEIDTLRAEDRNRTVKRNAEAVAKLDQKLFELHDQFRTSFGEAGMNEQQAVIFKQISDLMDEMAAMEKFAVTSKNPVERAQRLIQRADEIWSAYRGTTGTPISTTTAQIFTDARNLTMSGSLVFAPFASMFSDPLVQIASRQFAGMPIMPWFASFLKAFTPADRKLALAAGVGLDQARAAFESQARFVGKVNSRRWSGYISDRTHALSLLSPMTQAEKVAFSLDFLRYMADQSEKTFGDLSGETQRLLARHDISPVEWETLRKVTPEQTYKGAMLTRKAIEAQAGEELAQKFMVMLLRERGNAVVEGTLRGRTFFVSDTQPGTFAGELLRSGAMLKSFPTTYAMKIIGRYLSEVRAGRGMEAQGLGYITTIVIGGTILGGLAMQLKGLAQGKDPEDMTSKKFWAKAFLQSGGLGIYGDFVANSVNRFGGGLAQTIAGPLAQRVSTVNDLTIGNLIQYANDEKTNVGREAVNLLRQMTPGALVPWYARTAYDRLFLDELQRRVDSDAYKSFQSRMNAEKKNSGRSFYWSPGSTEPRSPNLGAAFGQ